jgi:hypothetical protein
MDVDGSRASAALIKASASLPGIRREGETLARQLESRQDTALGLVSSWAAFGALGTRKQKRLSLWKQRGLKREDREIYAYYCTYSAWARG